MLQRFMTGCCGYGTLSAYLAGSRLQGDGRFICYSSPLVRSILKMNLVTEPLRILTVDGRSIEATKGPIIIRSRELLKLLMSSNNIRGLDFSNTRCYDSVYELFTRASGITPMGVDSISDSLACRFPSEIRANLIMTQRGYVLEIEDYINITDKRLRMIATLGDYFNVNGYVVTLAHYGGATPKQQSSIFDMGFTLVETEVNSNTNNTVSVYWYDTATAGPLLSKVNGTKTRTSQKQ